jgi:hypothetical protein
VQEHMLVLAGLRGLRGSEQTTAVTEACFEVTRHKGAVTLL